jgi:hypothetical protein
MKPRIKYCNLETGESYWLPLMSRADTEKEIAVLKANRHRGSPHVHAMLENWTRIIEREIARKANRDAQPPYPNVAITEWSL